MKKFLLNVFLFILIVIAPFLGIKIYGDNMPEAYSETFMGELSCKYELLEKTNEKKIIFVGGSSLPFGLRSDLIEQATGYKVVNFGLYATLGTNVMMELSKANINEDDIVILAPEESIQTYSMYFNPLVTMQALESKPSMKKHLSFDEKMQINYNYYKFLNEKKKFLQSKANIEELAPYNKASFNEYGDISYDRKESILIPIGYDGSMLINLNDSLFDDEFISFVNKYNKYVTAKKAKLYFSFAPMNALAIEEKDELFEDKLSKLIGCKLLGNTSDFIYNQAYFYDSNFHLNNAGAIIHSKNMVKLLCDELEIENKWSEEDPPMPKDPTFPLPDSSFSYYQTIQVSPTEVYISSVLDEYKESLVNISIPSEDDQGHIIAGISNNAFEGCTNLVEIHLPNTIGAIYSDAFKGCYSLLRLYITSENISIVPEKGLFDDVAEGFKFYVLEQYYSNYKSGYNWPKYVKYLDTFKEESL